MPVSKTKKNEPIETLTPGGVAVPPPLKVQSETFSGSLLTLFHLAREGRIDLTEIPLAPVCLAYIEYVFESGSQDVDGAGAGLLALAYLIERKAWQLLPIADPPEPEELPELPEPTAHEYATVVDALQEWHAERAHLFFRPGEADTEILELPMEVGDIRPEHLAKALERLLSRAQTVQEVVPQRKYPSLAEVMQDSMSRLKNLGGKAVLEKLLPENFTKMNVVLLFLAVLELLRIGLINAKLENGEISLSMRGEQG